MPNIYDPAKDPLVKKQVHVPAWMPMDMIHVAAACYEAERKVMFSIGTRLADWESLPEGDRIARLVHAETLYTGLAPGLPKTATELERRIRKLHIGIIDALTDPPF